MPSSIAPGMVLVSLLAAGANAGLVSLEAHAETTTHASIAYSNFGIVDEEYDGMILDRYLSSITGFDSHASKNLSAYAVNGLQKGDTRSVNGLNTTATSFEYYSDARMIAQLGDNGSMSSTEYNSILNLAMTFDTDTMLEVSLTIDYNDLVYTSLNAGFSFSGISGAPGTLLEAVYPTEGGAVSLSFTGTVLAGETFTLTGNGAARLETDGSVFNNANESVVMSANIRVVPAPATLGALSTLGLLATRRRR